MIPPKFTEQLLVNELLVDAYEYPLMNPIIQNILFNPTSEKMNELV